MYADSITKSMKSAIAETNRRRTLQMGYNKEHGIVPKSVKKSVREVIEATKTVEEEVKTENISELVDRLTDEMLRASRELRFEDAAKLRDKIKILTGGEENEE